MIDGLHTTLIILQLHMPIVQKSPFCRVPEAQYTCHSSRMIYNPPPPPYTSTKNVKKVTVRPRLGP